MGMTNTLIKFRRYNKVNIATLVFCATLAQILAKISGVEGWKCFYIRDDPKFVNFCHGEFRGSGEKFDPCCCIAGIFQECSHESVGHSKSIAIGCRTLTLKSLQTLTRREGRTLSKYACT